jgi:aryl-alcohol dehydrogenase-like predicted oxidoreductase
MVNRDIEKAVMPYARKNDIAIIAYSPLQRGLLTGKIKPGYRFNDGDTRDGNTYYSDENIRKVNAFLDKLQPLAKEKKATIGQLVIRWTIEQPGITIALVGARNAAQAIENAKASDIQLTSEELAYISGELAELKLIK